MESEGHQLPAVVCRRKGSQCDDDDKTTLYQWLRGWAHTHVIYKTQNHQLIADGSVNLLLTADAGVFSVDVAR